MSGHFAYSRKDTKYPANACVQTSEAWMLDVAFYRLLHIKIYAKIKILMGKEVSKMETRVEQALEKFKKNYNCAQAVACTYCDLVGMDEETMFKVTEGFGRGMGGMEGTCGALTGACVVVGMKKSTANLEKPDSKIETQNVSKQILEKFNEQNGSTICKELKGAGTGKILRACPDCVRDAARMLEEVLFIEENK